MNLLLVLSLSFVMVSATGSDDNSDNSLTVCEQHAKWLLQNDSGNNKASNIFTQQVAGKPPKYDITSIFDYSTKLEKAINKQIKIELHAFYSYLRMSRYFKKFDQDREGFAKYFRNAASEELGHAEMFMKYQEMRGGNVTLEEIPPPVDRNWRSGKAALITAFDMEKNVTEQILCLHNIAIELPDTDFANFLEEKVIPEQYESMKEIKTHIKTLDRACHTQTDECDGYPLYELRYDDILKEMK